MADEYMAKWIIEDIPGKPDGWPAYNLREVKVDRVWQDVREYYNNPNPGARDIMLRDAFCRERAELPSMGKYRISEYEAEMLRRIYRAGCCFNSCTLRMFAYHVVMEWIDDDRYIEDCNKHLPIEKMVVTESKKRRIGLPWQLQLFYDAYRECCEDWAQRRFAVILVEVCRRALRQRHTKEGLFMLEHAIVSLLYDISSNLGTDRDSCLAIKREEIKPLIELEAYILRKRRRSIMRRPLKGTLMVQLSNLILKSRHNGSPDTVYKYISNDNLTAAVSNKQVWISDVRDLNDKHEGEVAQEIVQSISVGGPSWVKKCSLKYKKSFYVGCYSKTLDIGDLNKRYGECVLGYYGDRLVDYLGPVYWHTEKIQTPQGIITEVYPMFSQVFVLDVIYDKEEAKKEFQYLIWCIDKLGSTESQKRRFYNEILQYWKLSFKDRIARDEPHEEWFKENERRYVIHYYKEYNYRGAFVDKSDRKWKIDTTAVYAPDFLMGNPAREIRGRVAKELCDRYEYTTLPHYYVCKNCLAKGAYPDVFKGFCRECGCRSVTKHASKAFHYE